MLRYFVFTYLIVAMIGLQSQSKKEFSPENPVEQSAEEDVASRRLTFERGTIILKNGIATLDTKDTLRYLKPEQARVVLEEVWGNPPNEEDNTLGMIIAATVDPVAETGWGITIVYNEDGWINDDVLANIDSEGILKSIQSESKNANDPMEANDYESLDVMGWALPPIYDRNLHALLSAKRLKFGDSDAETLHYNLTFLGRKGILSLNAVSSLDQFQEIDSAMKKILTQVKFNPGFRYEDYRQQEDRKAAYSALDLVSGKDSASQKNILTVFRDLRKILLVVLTLAILTVFHFLRRHRLDAIRAKNSRQV